MNKELALHIVLLNPPTGYDFGLQKGSRNNYEIIDIQRSVGCDLHFSLSIAIKTKTDKPHEPLFSGPFVQGPAGVKFIYISIGNLTGQMPSVNRRLKVPLYGIADDVLLRAVNNADLVLETRINGTAKDGGPNCATVKPFDGWKLIDYKLA